MDNMGFCKKDNRETPIKKGCLHPTDYCQFRQSCMIYFIEQEESRKSRGDGKQESDIKDSK